MKYLRNPFLAILLAINCVLPVVAAEEKSSIPEAYQTILKGDWTPTKYQTDQALAAGIAFVRDLGNQPLGVSYAEKYKHEGALKISRGIADYAIQFIGQTKKGKKVIFCNFFPSKLIKSEFAYWETSLVEVDDGGSSFWQIDYDPIAEVCLNFQINGDA